MQQVPKEKSVDEYVAEAQKGYEDLAKMYEEFLADPEAFKAKWSWQVIGNPTVNMRALQRENQTPEGIRQYSENEGKDVRTLYKYQKIVLEMSVWKRLGLVFSFWAAYRWYNIRRAFHWNVSAPPFFPNALLLGNERFKELDRLYRNAYFKLHLVLGCSFDEAMELVA